jgi:hypothetical protein
MKSDVQNRKDNMQDETTPKFDFVFGKRNYIFMLAGLAIMAIGYLCLIGGGTDDPNVFNDAIFSTRRMVVAPLLIVAGLVIEVFAIMIRSKK